MAAGMKSLVLVVTALGALGAPALANTPKQQPAAPKPAVAAVDKTESTDKTDMPAPAPTAPEPLDIPVLPADTSSPFEQLFVARPTTMPAAAPVKPSKAKRVVMNMGKDYVLGGRQSAKPATDVIQIVPRTLSQAQVATVVQAHITEIQNCWDLVPKAERADACTAMLNLSISDAGQVSDVELGGDVPASAQQCMTSAIATWTFPVAETRTEIEYGISLRSL